MDTITRTMDTVIRAMDTITRTMNTVTRTVDTITRTIDTITRTMDPITRTIDAITRTMDTFTRTMDTITRTQSPEQWAQSPEEKDQSLHLCQLAFQNVLFACCSLVVLTFWWGTLHFVFVSSVSAGRARHCKAALALRCAAVHARLDSLHKCTNVFSLHCYSWSVSLCSHWPMSHHGASLCLLVSSISEDEMGVWRGGGDPNFKKSHSGLSNLEEQFLCS